MPFGSPLSSRALRRAVVLAAGPVFAVAALSPAALAHRAATPAATPKGDPVAGKQLFRTRCGGCHTLRLAGTHGRIGPNLNWDELEYSTVTWMVTNGDSLMPGFKGVLKASQIKDVAAFVTVASSS